MSTEGELSLAGRPDSLIVYCQAWGNNYEWYSVLSSQGWASDNCHEDKIYEREGGQLVSERGMRDQAASGGRSEVIENTFRFILESD